MKILVIDGQGGGLGKQLVAALSARCPQAQLTAVGTNSLAASAMRKAGAVRTATNHTGGVNGGVLYSLTDIRLRSLGKGGRGHAAEIGGIEIRELFNVEDSRGFGDTGNIEDLDQLV